MSIIGHFGASDDQTIKIRVFFDKTGLLRPVRLHRPPRSMRLQSAKLAISKVALSIQCMEFNFFCGQIPSFEAL
jgi:hypothetical protein